MSRELSFDINECEEWQYYGDGLKFGYHFISEDETLVESEDFDKLVEIIDEQHSSTSGIVNMYFFDEGTTVASRHGGIEGVSEPEWMFESNLDAVKVGRFELDDGQRVPSVNAEYIPVRRGKRVQKTLTGWGREYKEILQNQAEFTEFYGWVDRLREAGHEKGRRFRLKFEMVVFFSHQFNSRDVTNMVKLTEDALAKYVMKIDDQFNTVVPLTKYCNRDKNEPERVYIRATVLNTVWDEE